MGLVPPYSLSFAAKQSLAALADTATCRLHRNRDDTYALAVVLGSSCRSAPSRVLGLPQVEPTHWPHICRRRKRQDGMQATTVFSCAGTPESRWGRSGLTEHTVVCIAKPSFVLHPQWRGAVSPYLVVQQVGIHRSISGRVATSPARSVLPLGHACAKPSSGMDLRSIRGGDPGGRFGADVGMDSGPIRGRFDG